MDRSKIGIVVGLSAEAKLLRGSGFMVGIGGGFPAGAARAAEMLVSKGAAALISFGLAGGLNPALRPGAVLIPRSVIDGDDTFICNVKLIEMLGMANADTMVSAKEIVETAQHKKALFEQTQADGIDLESGAVGRVAFAANIPFAVLRAVADPAERNLPPAALIALNGAGEIRLIGVLASVFKKPSQIPELLVLARDAAKARAALLRKLQQIS